MVSHKEIPIGYDSQIIVIKDKSGLSRIRSYQYDNIARRDLKVMNNEYALFIILGIIIIVIIVALIKLITK